MCKQFRWLSVKTGQTCLMAYSLDKVLLTSSITLFYILTQGLCVTGTPQILDAVKDKSIILRCNISGETASEPSISWTGTVNNTIKTFYSVSSCTPTIVIAGDALRGFTGGCETVNGIEMYRLTVPNVTVDMERFTWRCTLERLGSPSVTVSEIKLNVKVMVRRAEITNLPNTVLADKSTNIICVTSPSKPEACIRMFLHKEGSIREITTGQPVCNQDSNNILPTTRTQVFTPKAEDNGSNLYCTANNSVTDTTVRSQDYRLNVQYPPKSSITVSDYVSNSPVEPGPISLTCDVGEGNPEPTLTWSAACAGRVPGNNGRQTITLNVDRSLNGKSCSCRGNQAGSLAKWTGNKSVTFNVTFGPDSVSLTSDSGQSGERVHVTENTTIRLTCTGGESNPPAILTWYRNNSIGQTVLLDQTRGDNNGYIVSGRYTLIPDRYMDGRAVRCEARRLGQQTSRNTSIILDVKYKPVIVCRENKITVFDGQPVDVSCVFESNPSANVRVLINNKQVDPLYISLTNSSRTNHTQSLNLKLPATELSSSGLIGIIATNTIGATNLDISVTIRAGQFLTEDIDIIQCDNKRVTLTWASGIEASLVDYFKLEYRRRGMVWEVKLVQNPGQLKVIQTTLSDLKTGVNYEFRIQPNFNVALSQYATTNCTPEDIGKNETPTFSAVSIGVGIVIGAVLVVLVVMCVNVILLRRGNLIWNKGFRRSNQSHGQELPSMTVTGNTQIGTYEDIDMNRTEGKPYETMSTTTIGGVYENSAAI